MVIRMRAGPVRALDYRETAPRRASHDMYVDSAGNVTPASLTGHLSVGVPGSVAGMFEAHRKLGKLPWRELLAPAIRLAREGYELDSPRSRQIGMAAERLGRFPASAAQFLVKGQEAPPGTRFVQPELARTLQLIADSGPRVFYRGSIAELIVQEMERGGGLITHEDLARYRPKWRNPIRIAYRGYTIYTMPPPSGGGVTLAEILNVMEGYAPLPAFGSAALMHLQTEAMRRAYIDRNRYLGDPDFVDMPLERLLSKSYAGELRAAIDAQRATPTPPSAGVRSEGTQTMHYSIVDTAGDAVSCTTTLNNDFGSAVTVTGAGFLLNDEMDDFTSAPGKPNLFGLIQGEANAIAPGKRMLSAMTPSIVLDPARRLARRGRSPARRRCRRLLGGPLHRQGLVELQRDGGALRQHDVDVARRPRRGRAGARAHDAADHGAFPDLPDQLAHDRAGGGARADLGGVRLGHAPALLHRVHGDDAASHGVARSAHGDAVHAQHELARGVGVGSRLGGVDRALHRRACRDHHVPGGVLHVLADRRGEGVPGLGVPGRDRVARGERHARSGGGRERGRDRKSVV